MKCRLLFLLVFFSIGKISLAQTKVPEITIAEAKDHAGEKVTICGEVADVYVNKKAKGEPTMLNFGAAYPKQSFTCIIWKDDVPNFKYVPATYLRDKQICVTGIIKMYKGKPEMELHKQDQVFE